jgi:dTMP kinase
MFIVFEGIDGSGKTTHAKKLSEKLIREKYPVYFLSTENSDSKLCRELRLLLKDPKHQEISSETEALLYFAIISQRANDLILPHLNEGSIVISDRHIYSTFAISHYGRGLELDILRKIADFATGNLTPDLIIYLDISEREALKRKQCGNTPVERKELSGIEFFQRMREGFLSMKKTSRIKWLCFDTSRNKEVIENAIFDKVMCHLTNSQKLKGKISSFGE